jgi:hypothetical protein
MKTLKGLAVVLFFVSLVSCGDGHGNTDRCISREAKIFECRALEAGKNYYNTPAMLDAQKAKCERTYQVNRCY